MVHWLFDWRIFWCCFSLGNCDPWHLSSSWHAIIYGNDSSTSFIHWEHFPEFSLWLMNLLVSIIYSAIDFLFIFNVVLSLSSTSKPFESLGISLSSLCSSLHRLFSLWLYIGLRFILVLCDHSIVQIRMDFISIWFNFSQWSGISLLEKHSIRIEWFFFDSFTCWRTRWTADRHR